MKMPGMPHFFMKASPRGMRSGCRDNGHTCTTVRSSLSPIQYDTQSPKAAPSEAETQIGQNLISLELIKAPIATSAPHAGIKSEMKASDSPNANAKTTGTAQAWLV